MSLICLILFLPCYLFYSLSTLLFSYSFLMFCQVSSYHLAFFLSTLGALLHSCISLGVSTSFWAPCTFASPRCQHRRPLSILQTCLGWPQLEEVTLGTPVTPPRLARALALGLPQAGGQAELRTESPQQRSVVTSWHDAYRTPEALGSSVTQQPHGNSGLMHRPLSASWPWTHCVSPHTKEHMGKMRSTVLFVKASKRNALFLVHTRKIKWPINC